MYQDKRLLLFISKGDASFRVISLINELKKQGFGVFIFKDEASEECIPFYYWETFFVEDKNNYDLFVHLGERDFEEEIFTPSINFDDSDLLGNLEKIVFAIKRMFATKELDSFSFLVTIGFLKEYLDCNHYLAVDSYKKLDKSLIETLLLKGAHVTVLALGEKEIHPEIKEIIMVDEEEDFFSILESKRVKNDIIFNCVSIPRFGLVEGEQVKVEYNRYFAEFKEKHLPFKGDEGDLPEQLVVHFINGLTSDGEEMDYYFQNTNINILIKSERENRREFKKFSKAYFKDGSFKVLSYETTEELAVRIINEAIEKVERW